MFALFSKLQWAWTRNAVSRLCEHFQVTEEEFEFYEALRAQDRRKKLARQREEDAMRDEFHKAREQTLNLSVSSAASSARDRRSTESDGSSIGSVGKPSPFAALGTQKQRNRLDSPLAEGSIFDVTTKAFQEKRRKRALDVSTHCVSLIYSSRCFQKPCCQVQVLNAASTKKKVAW